MYCLDSLYRGAATSTWENLSLNSNTVYLTKDSTLYVFVSLMSCGKCYFATKHVFIRSRNSKACISDLYKWQCQLFCCYFLCHQVFYLPSVYQTRQEGKLLIALFSPLMGVAVKAISRICVQRLWNISHPGYSYVLLAPLYLPQLSCFEFYKQILSSLESIALLGIIHGFAEVIERSTMVVIDHICHQIWRRASTPWGSFRTPRRERLMADIAIMSMLFESTAVVSVNGFLYLYQFIYLENDSLLKLLQSFAIHTSVPLVD